MVRQESLEGAAAQSPLQCISRSYLRNDHGFSDMTLLKRLGRINRLFLATVVVPTLLAAVYYGLIASDIYISESRFMVRSPAKPIQTGVLGTLLQGSGLTRNLDDQNAVHDYILSRDALKELDSELGLHKKFQDRGIDFVNRFAALDWNDSFER